MPATISLDDHLNEIHRALGFPVYLEDVRRGPVERWRKVVITVALPAGDRRIVEYVTPEDAHELSERVIGRFYWRVAA